MSTDLYWFLLRALVSEFWKVLTAKRTVSIKSTVLKNSKRFLLSVPYITKIETLTAKCTVLIIEISEYPKQVSVS